MIDWHGVLSLPYNPKGMTNLMGLTDQVGDPTPILTTHCPRVSMGFAWGPLIYPYIEITCASQSKTVPRNQISYVWKGDPEYLEILLSTRKFSRIKGFRLAFHHYINYKPYPSWGTWILPNSCTLEFLEILLLLT